MTTLYLPVGPPASGKSTLVETLIIHGLFDRDAVVSPDRLRIICTGSVAKQHENGTVFSIVSRLVSARLRNSLDVWLDATNLRLEWCSEYIRQAEKYEAEIVWVVLDTSDTDCMIRNAWRTDPVPQEVMLQMFAHRDNWDPHGVPGTVIPATTLTRDCELMHNLERVVKELEYTHADKSVTKVLAAQYVDYNMQPEGGHGEQQRIVRK